LLRQAATVTDQNKRKKLYNQVQNMVIEEAPYIYLYQKSLILPMNKRVKGYVYNPMLQGIYNLATMSKNE
jgi:peptide/nickel transport system substrate-binding protein